MKLPVYAKAVIAAVGTILTVALPYITDHRWIGIVTGTLTVLGVFGYPNASAPATNAADSPPAAK